MVLSDTLFTYLADLNEQAQQRMEILISQMQAAEGVTQALKATDPMAWAQRMNGKTLREMDQIIYPVCTLCRDHEKTGFQEGIKVGIRLAQEANITQQLAPSIGMTLCSTEGHFSVVDSLFYMSVIVPSLI